MTRFNVLGERPGQKSARVQLLARETEAEAPRYGQSQPLGVQEAISHWELSF
jgi:hypothetical protein